MGGLLREGCVRFLNREKAKDKIRCHQDVEKGVEERGGGKNKNQNT